MKKILNTIQFLTLVTFILAGILSCSNLIGKKSADESETAKKNAAYITLSVSDIGRNVNPVVDVNALTNLVLKGTKTGGTEQTLGSWDAVNELQTAKCAVSTGEWSFTLTAKAGGVNGTTLSGTTSKQIELGDNALSFALSISDDGEGVGSFNINLNYAGAENADKVDYISARLETIAATPVSIIDSTQLTPSSNTVSFESNNIPAGTYRAFVIFYATRNGTRFEIATYRELVQISSGLTSSATRQITSFDNLYTITYHLNGGSLADGVTLQETFTRKSSITLPTGNSVTRNYYDFIGWYTDQNCTVGNEISTVTNIATNLNVYAKFTPIQYSITYNLNGGTNPTGTTTTYTIESDTITLPTPQKDNNVFRGWFEQENFSDTLKTEIASGSHGARTYYAKWLPKCTVHFVTAHGTAPADFILGEGDTFTATNLLNLSAEGYCFCGWYSNASYDSDKKVRVGHCVTTDLTLYAKWIERTGPSDGFVFVEGGTVVGDSSYNQENTGAFPAGRTVTLSSFYMSDHELTQAEYVAVMETNPSNFYSSPASGEVQGNRPVENVSWYDAIYFCNKYSESSGLTPCYKVDGNTSVTSWNYIPHNGNSISGTITCDMTANGYRLPTEAEWEYAARGGQETYGTSAFANYFAGATTTNYSASSNNDLSTVAWYKSNSSSKTHEVKKKAPNALNLYDMSGNVWEWCWDWYGSISTSETVTDPCGASSGSYRVLRGGSWYGYAYYCSVSRRSCDNPDLRSYSFGFRLVRSAQ